MNSELTQISIIQLFNNFSCIQKKLNELKEIQTLIVQIQQQNNIIESDQSNYDSFQTITKSLSFIQENLVKINLQEIIPFYNELDLIIFDNVLNLSYIYSEMKDYDNIEQIQNQRILIQKNKQSSIESILDLNSQQLMAIKKIETNSLDNAIQKLDEYKIHYNMNKQYPQQSLKLFTPVKIWKQNSIYKIYACLERAQFNLYEYSRQYQITKEHAYDILFLILHQIINMHSINIAHRDVKPQNIFYVKNKGWILCDFGESQYYQEIYSQYNIRGTIYFLLPTVKSQIHKNKLINQNLLVNDIYASIISIIMIQQQKYISNIQEELEGQQDQVIRDLIKITCLDELVSFVQSQNFMNDKIYYIHENSIYKQLSPKENQENCDLVFNSWLNLYSYYDEKKLNTQLMKQLLQLIQKHVQQKQIYHLDSVAIHNLYFLLFNGIQIQLDQPNNLVKQFDKFNMEQKGAILQLLFQFGFNEKTIFYARKLLNHTYCQQLHLLVIFSYQRAFMYDEATKEISLFNQYLQFDQLDTSSQYDYLLGVSQNYSNLSQSSQEYIDKFLSQNVVIRKNELPCLSMFKIKHYIQTNFEKNTTVDVVIHYLQNYCAGAYNIAKENTFAKITKHMYSMMPIEIYKLFIEEITVKYIESIDNNRKIPLFCDLGEILIMFNQTKLIKQNYKKIKQFIFNPDSLSQQISFNIQIQFLKIRYQKKQKKLHFSKNINIIKQQIQKCSLVKIFKYQASIMQNLLSLIHRLYIEKIQHNANILYIIQLGIQYAYKHQYHLQNSDGFINYHKKAQNILYKLRNQKRIISLKKSYESVLNNDARQYIAKIQMTKIRINLKQDIQNQFKESKKKLQSKFLFEQYLNRY
ncbi:hypothetical protein pb186bvf_001813 [Paramecium bursaria]